MWQSNVTGGPGKWTVEAKYPDLTVVSQRILSLEGDPATTILNIHVLANLPVNYTEILSDLPYKDRKALYAVRQWLQ